MTEDRHAQANARQVQVLREELMGTEVGAGEEPETAAQEPGGPAPAGAEDPPLLP